jgi:beta-xylosidase
MKKIALLLFIAIIALLAAMPSFASPPHPIRTTSLGTGPKHAEIGVDHNTDHGTQPADLSLATFDAALSPFQGSWTDDFNSPTLDSRWSWVREDSGLWSLTNNPGYLQITSNGSLYQTINNKKNILITPAPMGDFRVTTKVHASPSENYHGAGVYLYQDDDNYVGVLRIYADGQRVGFRTEVAGVTSSSYVDVTQDTLLLRVVKEGDEISGWLSEDDGATWEYISKISLTLTNPKIGLSSRMGPTMTPLTADFDWISLERIIYNHGWIDEFDLLSIDGRWGWVRENPSLWSLSANPGHLQITSSGSIFETLSNDLANILLTTAPGGDFRITGKVTATPTENYHGGPIFVYQDDDNYVELSFEHRDGLGIGFRKEEAGVVSVRSVQVLEETIWLRVVKESDTYYAWFSEIGEGAWEYLGQFTIALIAPQVGLSARMGPTATPITTSWDYFKLECYSEKLYLPLILR